MKTNRIELEIGYGITPVAETLDFEFTDDPEDFQQAFLKRFGNIGGTNQAEKDRRHVKQLTYQVESINDIPNWASTVNIETTWRFDIKRQYKNGVRIDTQTKGRRV